MLEKDVTLNVKRVRVPIGNKDGNNAVDDERTGEDE